MQISIFHFTMTLLLEEHLAVLKQPSPLSPRNSLQDSSGQIHYAVEPPLVGMAL